MPLDANIILQGRQAQIQNPMDIAKDALTMRQLALQNQGLEKQTADQNTMSSILRKNTMTDEQGNTTLNKGAALSDLYKVNPQKAMDFQKHIQGADLETLDFQAKAAKTLAWQLTPDNMGQIKAKAVELGLPNADKIPDQYSPEFAQRWQIATLEGEKQLDNHIKEQNLKISQGQLDNSETKTAQDYEIAKEKLQLEKQKAAKESKSGGMTEGQKALDKDYAKDYNDWTSTGKAALDKNLQRLQEAKTMLQNDKTLTGSIRGMLPDAIRNTTNEKAIAVRDQVRAAAQGALKATLGSAFTEKEGERIMNQAYNEKLSPEENIRKIDLAIQELETNRTNNESKASLFGRTGSISKLAQESQQQQSQRVQPTQSQTIRMMDPKGNVREIPAEQVGEAIAAGGKKI